MIGLESGLVYIMQLPHIRLWAQSPSADKKAPISEAGKVAQQVKALATKSDV